MPLRVLVTGASRGFGAALALAFAEQGARVFAGVRSTRSGLGQEFERYPGLVNTIELDVQSARSVAEAQREVARSVDALDVLVNNAAVRSPTVSNPISTVDFDDVAWTFDVNSIGPLRVTQAFLPLLERGTAPVLVNVSSEAGSVGQCGRTGEFDYCMSKAAVIHMTKAMALEWGRYGINVNAICPGYIETEINSTYFKSEGGQS